MRSSLEISLNSSWEWPLNLLAQVRCLALHRPAARAMEAGESCLLKVTAKVRAKVRVRVRV
jgi:hypothetical protein